MDRPLGLSSVTNPLPSTGGAGTESRDTAWRNAPLGVLTLDRIVSVKDYEDFTRQRAGIGKASAARLSDGVRQVVHITIAGTDDIPIDTSSDLHRNLRLALAQNGTPGISIRVVPRELALLVIQAGVRIDPAYLWKTVATQVRAALQAAFSFEARELGQPVYSSEVIAAIQSVPGVDYVDLDFVDLVPETITPAELIKLEDKWTQIADSGARPDPVLPVQLARFDENTFRLEEGQGLAYAAAHTGLTIEQLVHLNPGFDPDHKEEVDVLTFRGIRPAQLALLSATVDEMLVLREIKS